MHEIRNTLPHLGASAARSLQIAFRERLSRALRWQFPREDWVERCVCTVTIFFLFLADLFDTLWEIQHFQNKYCEVCSLFCWILKLNESLKLAGQFHYHCLLENSWISTSHATVIFPCSGHIVEENFKHKRFFSSQYHFSSTLSARIIWKAAINHATSVCNRSCWKQTGFSARGNNFWRFVAQHRQGNQPERCSCRAPWTRSRKNSFR